MLYYLIFYGVDMLLWSAALVLTLAVIALVSGHRLSRAQKIWILILALYLAAVYNVAGAPELPYIYPNFNVNLIPFIDIRSDVPAYLINSGLNIILFMPLGFILPLLWRRFRSRKRIILTGFLFSLAIELSQLLNYRITDVDDLIMNSLGAWLGYELLMFLNRRSAKGLLLSSVGSIGPPGVGDLGHHPAFLFHHVVQLRHKGGVLPQPVHQIMLHAAGNI